MGQLLAAHNLLAHLSGPQQLGEFAAHALRVLPGARATAARLDGETALEGEWDPLAWEQYCGSLEGDDAYRWQELAGESLLVLQVASLGHRHGCLYVLGSRPQRIEPYLPFLANFAAGLALTLENQRQRAQLEAASAQLRASQAEYEQLFASMASGFAVHEIITDEHGSPVDYRFLEVNRAFEELTGLRRADILGRTARQVLPGLEPVWVETYGRVAMRGEQVEFEDYSVPLGRHYHVVAYSPAERRFATVFSDITERKQAERERQLLIEQLQAQSERFQQLLEEQRRIATTLQANFLHPLPAVAGWEFGLATEAASEAELIGGDFHDVFVVSDEQLAILLGDVEGKGVAAAGLTETVHAAARALALSTPSPDYVLERLNTLLLAQQSALVTALFLVVERSSGVLRIGSAGHPAPLHLHRDGSVESLRLAPGPPLGAFEESRYEIKTSQLQAGDALLLYTDGVVEARRGDLFFGEQGLLAASERLAGGSAQEIAEDLRLAVNEYAGELRDDVHILVVKRARE